MNTPEPQSASAAKPAAFFSLRSSDVVAVGLVALTFVFFSTCTPLAHREIWSHLKFGEWIVENQELPETEPFLSFSDQEPCWNFHWLAQVIFYLTYHAGERSAGNEFLYESRITSGLLADDELRRMAGGVAMLRDLYGLLQALKVGLMMLAIRRMTRSLPLAIAGAVLLIFLTLPLSQVESPHQLGEVFFLFLLWWLSGRQLSAWTWLVVPFLFALWVNCERGFVAGLALLALRWIGCMLQLGWDWWNGRPMVSGQESWLWHGLGAIVLAPLAVALLNPYGQEIFSRMGEFEYRPNLKSMPGWATLNFSEPWDLGWAYLATLFLLALSQAVSPRALPLALMVVLIPFAVLPPYQVRMLPWWLMLAPWFAAVLWRDTTAVLPRFWVRFRRPARLWKTGLAAALVLGALLSSGVIQLLIGRAPPLSESTTSATLWSLAMELKYGEEMPVLTEALREYPQQSFEGRILAQADLADFLVWSLPRAPVLVYSRAYLFPEKRWKDQITALTGEPGWEKILADYRVNMVILDPVVHPDLAFALREDTGWIVVLDGWNWPSEYPWTSVAQAKLFIAVRSAPIETAE